MFKMSYDEFWMKYLSLGAVTYFSKEEIAWAIKQTEYKYFGYYELSDQERIAVEILVWAAKEEIKDV